MKRTAGLLLALSILGPLHAQPSGQREALTDLVRRFETARHDFDLTTITTLAAANYVEISPLGEVDPHDKMLSYYAPEKKIAAPPMTVDDFDVRLVGDSAVIIAKLSYQMTDRVTAMRVTYMTHREPSGWKFVSVQYTPIRQGH